MVRWRVAAIPAFVNFALGGALIALLGAVLLEVLVRVGASPLSAQAIQLTVTLILNFAYNYKITWRDRPRTGLPRQVVWFLVTRGATQTASWFAFVGLTALGLEYQLANCICLVGAMAVNFVTSDKLVFRDHKPSKQRPLAAPPPTLTADEWRSTGRARSSSRLARATALAQMIWRVTACLLAVTVVVSLGVSGHGLLRQLLMVLLAVIAVGLASQALFALWLMVYTWDRPERMAAARGPARFCQPRHTFTVLLPARHEEAVIGETVRKVAMARYPAELVDIRVVCHVDDEATIAAARTAAAQGGFTNVQIQTFAGSPISKPRGLNEGLARSRNEVVCIFDAEDDVHPDIFSVVNTVMAEEGVGIVQAGVQLVNFLDRWFSVHNCLEYFFWYKSRLHWHAKAGMIPLGGNTVFLRRDLVEEVGGWDETCLTEDADIGMRLSALGEPIRVVYDREWVTREETPHTVRALVKQRTRWNQGFLQVLFKGDWRRLPGYRRRAFAFLTLGQPLLDAALIASLPMIVIGALLVKLPVLVALLWFMPLYAVLLQMVTITVGARMFAHEFNLRLPIRTLMRVPVTFLPYQWLITFGALRAVVRQIAGRGNWEKTEHLGAHRPVPVPVLNGRPVPALLGSPRPGTFRRSPVRTSGVLGFGRSRCRRGDHAESPFTRLRNSATRHVG